MNSGQKTAVSLLLTVALFSAFVFTTFSPLFSKIETKFYEPERIAQQRSRLKETAEFCDSYIQNILDVLTKDYAGKDCVKSFLSQNPSESEVTERVQLTGDLFVKLPGLEGFRLLDKNGRNLHYSTYSQDVLKQQGTTKVYKNISDLFVSGTEIPFEKLSVTESENSKLLFNQAKNQMVVVLPVYDSLDMFRGAFTFFFRLNDLEKELIKANCISLSDSLALFVQDDFSGAGIVLGLPNIGRELFASPVLEAAARKSAGPDKVLSGNGDKYWVILSDNSTPYFTVSEIFQNDFFELPETAKILLCVCVFITAFLIVFLLFSFKTDDMVLIRSRIKKIQFAFVAEYLENKENVDWSQVSRQIEGRKADLFRDVKKSLGRKGRRHESQVDALLNKSWDEILSAIGTRQNFEQGIAYRSHSDSAELKKMLEEVLGNTKLQISQDNIQVKAPAVQVAAAAPAAKVPVTEPEEIEEIEEAEAVEELADVEEAEEIEEIEEAEAVEELSDVEEAEEIEEIEEAEAVEELTDVEEAEVVEELADVEEAEEIEEIEEAEAVEELADVEEAEEVEEIDEAEAVEELADVEEAEEIEEIEEAEAVEELADVEEAEEFEDAEVVEETEEAEPEDMPSEAAEEKFEPVDEFESESVEEIESLEKETPVEEVASVEAFFGPASETAASSEEPAEELPDEEKPEVVENLPDVEEPEAVEELTDVEESEETEAVEDLAEPEETEVVEELSDVEEAEETETVEELSDVEEPEETEALEEIGGIEIVECDEFEEKPTAEESPDPDNSITFIAEDEDGFATVDDVYAEELHFGESYIRSLADVSHDELEESLDFVVSDPSFGENEELIPVEDKNYFSLSDFGSSGQEVLELESEETPIVENDGVFSISESLELPKNGLDREFKKLVDAVLH